MFKKEFQDLSGVFRAALQGAALAIAITLFCGTLSSAKCPSPSDQGLSTLLGWSIEQHSASNEATQMRFRRDQEHNHVWVARIASLELRLEWGSGHGRNTWSVTLLDFAGKQVAHAMASTETDKCI